MLVLSRQKDESIVVLATDGKTELGKIAVVDIRGDKVRIGVTFPKEYGVHREEVWVAIQREQQEASETPGLAGGSQSRR